MDMPKEAKSEAMSALFAIDGMAGVLTRADHVDIKTVTGDVSLRRFVAGLMSYRPAWVRLLYWLRGGLAKAMGLRHDAVPGTATLTPEDVPMIPGGRLSFLTVAHAGEERHWIAFAEDKHLAAWICVLATPRAAGGARFDVATVVVYRHWTGPLYFNAIRPFHHMMVAGMARAAVRRSPATTQG
jgi:hypothetical protein